MRCPGGTKPRRAHWIRKRASRIERPETAMPRRSLLRLWIRLRGMLGNDRLLLVLLAVVIGLVAAFAVIAFRLAVSAIQGIALDYTGSQVYQNALYLPSWQILLAPTLGGLVIGLFTFYIVPGGQPRGVPAVMEAAALRGGKLSLRAAILGGLANAISVGVGGSVGREGAVINLAA